MLTLLFLIIVITYLVVIVKNHIKHCDNEKSIQDVLFKIISDYLSIVYFFSDNDILNNYINILKNTLNLTKNI